MDSENNYLDRLYSDKFEKFEFKTSEDDWNALNSKLSISNFLKFSFATFNIYNLVIMIILVCIAAYFGIPSINQSGKTKNPENKTENLKEIKTSNLITIDSAKAKNCFKKIDKSKKNRIIDEVKNIEIPQNNSDKNANYNTISPPVNSAKDSIQVKPDSSSILNNSAQKIKRVKKTVFIKKDAVIVTDTVKVKKKVK